MNPSAPPARVHATRFGSIDAVRGCAMLFVFLSHFTAGYLWKGGALTLASYLGTVSMIASPTFVIVSGMVVGFLAITNPLGFGELRLKLVDRGLFVLVFGHLLLTLTLGSSLGGFARAIRTSFITDAIAVAIIIGPSLVHGLRPPARLALALALFLVDWSAVLAWHPLGAALTAKLYLFGRLNSTGELGTFPVFAVVPWFAVYLAGTVVGERIGKMYIDQRQQAAHRHLVSIGGASILAALTVQVVTMLLRRSELGSAARPDVLDLFSVYEKFPPGLVYLGFFGGAGLLLLASVFEIDRRGWFPIVMDQLRKIGRASLFIFTVQYCLYRTVFGQIGLPYTPFWPILFGLSVIVLAALAGLWDSYTGNRFLTVGFTSRWFTSLMKSPAPTALPRAAANH